MKPVIFFDMDGVLANFVAGALKHHKREDIPHGKVNWGIEAQLGYAPADFWATLGFDFWAGLEPYADGLALLKAAERLVGPESIGLLTSPCDTDGCVDGKRSWVKKHLPLGYSKRLMVGSSKELFAGRSKILVDDHDYNVQKFAAAGGYILQPPRPWNQHAEFCTPEGFFSAPVAVQNLTILLNQIKAMA